MKFLSTVHIQWLKHQIKCQCKYGIFVFKLHWPMEQTIVARCAYVLLNTMRLEIWCRKKIEFNQSLYAGFRSGVVFFRYLSLYRTNSKENSKKNEEEKNRMFFICIATRYNIQVQMIENNKKKWILNCFVYRWCLAAYVCISIAPVDLIILWAQ